MSSFPEAELIRCTAIQYEGRVIHRPGDECLIHTTLIEDLIKSLFNFSTDDEVMDFMIDQKAKFYEIWDNATEGFLTTKGNFVDRIEAAKFFSPEVRKRMAAEKRNWVDSSDLYSDYGADYEPPLKTQKVDPLTPSCYKRVGD